jgi:hypothetical protein
MAIAIALLLSGCGSSRSSKQATYDGCEIYDYFDNRLLGEEAVEERSDWSEVRGYYKDRQVYVLHISTGYESWVEGGRPNDSVTGGCYFVYTADGNRDAKFYFDNGDNTRCWKIPLYDESGEYAHLSIYLNENGAFSHAGSVKSAGANTPKERDTIDSKGEFYYDQARETMNSLDPSFLVRIDPETSTPADEAAAQPSPQEEDSSERDDTPDAPEGAIDYTEAKSHVGETVAVTGEVKAAEYRSDSNQQPTYIDIGAPYPDESRVTMVVWGEDRSNFPGDPESIYLGKTVCVLGELYEHEGVVYMKVSTPDQVQVLG